MTSLWARWRLKSPASRVFTQTSKLRATGQLCKGNSPVTGDFPEQRASNAANVSIWWRHHGMLVASEKRWKFPSVIWAHNYPESSGADIPPSQNLDKPITEPITPTNGRPCLIPHWQFKRSHVSYLTGGLVKPLLMLGHGWIITSHDTVGVITYPSPNPI